MELRGLPEAISGRRHSPAQDHEPAPARSRSFLSRVAFREGALAGVLLAAAAIAFAFVGLSPAFAWFPEVPLLALGVLASVLACGLAGFRAGRAEGVSDGALAGALAGGMGGVSGGLAYVFFGKPVLNVVVGLVLGCLGGAAAGAISAKLLPARS